MPQFQTQATIRADLDAFTRGYVECMLWLMHDEEGESCDDFDGEISDKAYARIVEDCKDFQESQEVMLNEARDTYHMDDAQLGHDFYLTRCGHGSGFWDRDMHDVGDELSDASRPYGSMDAYIGDDGKVYVE